MKALRPAHALSAIVYVHVEQAHLVATNQMRRAARNDKEPAKKEGGREHGVLGAARQN
jgi:hypothetical protein